MPDTKYRKEHFDVLLGQLLRSPTLLHLAVQNIEGHHFTDKRVGGTPMQAMLFDTIKRYHAAHQVVPDGAVVMAEIQIFVDKFFRSPTKREKVINQLGVFLALSERVTEKSEPLARQLIQHITEICVLEPAIEDGITTYKEGGTLSTLRATLDEVDNRQAIMSGGLSFAGIVGMELDDVGERVSTHVPWLDSRFGGGQGPVLGSLVVILAPQGCGKTTLGIQLNVGQALSGRHTLLVLAEEGMTLSVRAKIIGCALGLEYDLIRDAKGDTFGERVEAAIAAKKINRQLAVKKLAMIEKYLHILDLVNRNVGESALEVIQGEVETLRSKGETPTYTYVDWAGIIADAVVSVSGRTKEAELKTLSYGLSRIAQQTNSIVCVSQQMAAVNVQKGPFAQNDQYCAADCKGFTEPAKYVFVINPQDPRLGYSILTVAKSRDDAKGERSVMNLQGAIPQFVDITDQWEIKGKKMVKRDRPLNDGKAPSEKPRKKKNEQDEVE